METLLWHSNKIAEVTAINSTFVNATAKNTSAKFKLYPTYSFSNIFPNFSLLVAMATNQI